MDASDKPWWMEHLGGVLLGVGPLAAGGAYAAVPIQPRSARHDRLVDRVVSRALIRGVTTRGDSRVPRCARGREGPWTPAATDHDQCVGIDGPRDGQSGSSGEPVQDLEAQPYAIGPPVISTWGLSDPAAESPLGSPGGFASPSALPVKIVGKRSIYPPGGPTVVLSSPHTVFSRNNPAYTWMVGVGQSLHPKASPP